MKATPANICELVEQKRKEGLSMGQIATDVQLPKATIQSILRRRGVKMRAGAGRPRCKMTETALRNLKRVTLAHPGATLAELASRAKLEVSLSTVSRALKKLKFTKRAGLYFPEVGIDAEDQETERTRLAKVRARAPRRVSYTHLLVPAMQQLFPWESGLYWSRWKVKEIRFWLLLGLIPPSRVYGGWGRYWLSWYDEVFETIAEDGARETPRSAEEFLERFPPPPVPDALVAIYEMSFKFKRFPFAKKLTWCERSIRDAMKKEKRRRP